MAWSDLNPYPFIGLFLALSVLAYTKPPNERPIAAKAGKNKSRSEAIEAAERILPNVSLEDDLPYLSCDATAIVENITTKKSGWTSLRVMQAFVRSAIRAHHASNPLTEIFFVEALEKARELDERFAQTGKAEGPLHGLPVSLKDQMHVKGADSSMGFSKYCNKPATEDSDVARIVRQQGGIIFCKTNIPQTMLAFECSNPVFGITRNPYNQEFTCGGSSGGEAVLAASDASALGLGSDIGGSLRIPAHYSGCYGLKPCYGRYPVGGQTPLNPGFDSVKSSFGPLGRSVADLRLLSKTIINGAAESTWRTGTMVPVPWRDDLQLPKKLKFGYYRTDEFLPVSPACQRAVDMSIKALQEAGHECVEVKIPDITKSLELFVAMSSSDAFEGLMSHIEVDPVEGFLFLQRLQGWLGPTLLGGISRLLSWVDPTTARILIRAGRKPVKGLLKAQAERDAYAKKLKELLWDELALDGLITPVQAVPAIPVGSGWNLAFLAIETILWNLVDSSAGVVPVTKVDSIEDTLTRRWGKEQTKGAKILHKAVYGQGKGIYDAKKMAGLPVGVQVVCSAWEEERTLALMEVLDNALGPREFGPGQFSQRQLEKRA